MGFKGDTPRIESGQNFHMHALSTVLFGGHSPPYLYMDVFTVLKVGVIE